MITTLILLSILAKWPGLLKAEKARFLTLCRSLDHKS